MRKLIPIILPVLGAFVVWLFFLWNSWRGIDFGYHWDEIYTQVSIQESVESGILVPTFYFYPGMCYDLGLLAILPGAFRELAEKDSIWTEPTAESNTGRSTFDIIQEKLKQYVMTTAFLKDYRMLCALVSSLLVMWVFGIGWAVTGSAWVGLVCSVLTAQSWELLYHSRWGVPDMMTASFSALTILLAIVSLNRASDHKWVTFASIAAGLTMATKYPGAIVLLVIWICIALSKAPDYRLIAGKITRSLSIAVITFLALSPGTILNPLRLYDSLQFIKRDYALGHPGHTVSAGFPHIGAMIKYAAISLPSVYSLMSLVVTALIVYGIVILLRRNWRLAAALLTPLVLYVSYMGTQRVFFARNSLLLWSFLIAFGASGLWALWNIAKRPPVVRSIIVGFVLFTAFLGAYTQMKSSHLTQNRVKDRPERVTRLVDYLSKNPKQTYLSPRIQSELRYRGISQPVCTAPSEDSADQVAFFAFETSAEIVHWHGDTRNLTVTTFGPAEVNFNFYPMWAGEDRIVLMSRDEADRIGLQLQSQSVGPYPLYEQ